MSTFRKILLAVFLVGILTVILLTWGSIGSAILTLALLLAGGYLLLNRFLQNHSAEDFQMDD